MEGRVRPSLTAGGASSSPTQCQLEHVSTVCALQPNALECHWGAHSEEVGLAKHAAVLSRQLLLLRPLHLHALGRRAPAQPCLHWSRVEAWLGTSGWWGSWGLRCFVWLSRGR